VDKATVSELSWFNLNNYSFIESLTVYEFITEIEWRHTLFYCADGDDVLKNGGFEDTIKFERIFRGDPHIDMYSEEEIEFNEEVESLMLKEYGREKMNRERPLLRHDTGVMPLTFAELAMYNRVAIKKGAYYQSKSGDLQEFNPHYMLASVSKNTDDLMNDRVAIDLYLGEATDAEILSSIKKLLPQWRKELSIPEPDILPRKRMGMKTIHKLLINRVLPILDILLWGVVFKKEITNPLLSHIVFPDDPKDSQAIKETLRPYAMEAMSEPYTRLLRLYVDNDGEIGSTVIETLRSRVS